MVIGDIPSAIECRKGFCMTGPAVDILKETMKKVGLPIGTQFVHYTTAVKCAVPKRKGKSIPTDVMYNCMGNIRDEIRAVKPKLVLILGKTALQTFMGDPKIKVTALEGRLLEMSEFPDTMILPIKHPALIIHSPGEYKNFLPSLELAYNLFVNKKMHDVGTVTWQVIRTEEDLFCLFNTINAQHGAGTWERAAADIETTDLDYRVAEFCVMGISFDGQHTYVFPREMRNKVVDLWRRLEGRTKVTWHHGKYDSKVMWRRGLGNIPHDGDTIYMHYVLNEQPPHDLGHLTKIYLQAPDYKFKMNQNFKAVTLDTYDSFFESLCERVAVDCAYTYQLETKLREELDKEPTLRSLYEDLLIPAAPFLSRVERNGMLVNPTYLEAMGKDYEQRLRDIMKEVQELADPFWSPEIYKAEMQAKTAPEKFNPGSPRQMSWMVFRRLKLKPRIKKGLSTNADVLESIEPQHPLVEKVLEHRRVQKEYSTYVIGLLKRRDIDGRVRSNFNAHITATGRLSSTEPNVQNIPSAFGVGNVRRAFRARKGYILMEVDYSGAELRWLACLSGCPVLTKIFVDGINLHDYTAEALYGKDFTKQDRMRAKEANFGELCYVMPN